MAATRSTDVIASDSTKQLPGYTVTDVPSNWNLPRDRHSRVIEVADTFVGPSDTAGECFLHLKYLRCANYILYHCYKPSIIVH
ncbi:unnamed protein product [Anisakis simplex]|uniref:Uncharacterized protein n=1 Tax=Anisakis simplex TaxID=6269 RepID=A0A0M3JEJ6_ANISI|nr:unnamed protein product [Anisakis simplex]